MVVKNLVKGRLKKIMKVSSKQDDLGQEEKN